MPRGTLPARGRVAKIGASARRAARAGRGLRVRFALAILTVLTAWPATATAPVATTPVDAGSSTRFLANSADPGVDASWMLPAFDASTWPTGTFGVGYEVSTGAESLLQTVLQPGTRSAYTRTAFTLDDPASVEAVLFGIDFDDGVVAWLNGVEIYRSDSMPAGAPAWNSAPVQHESSNGALPTFETTDVTEAALPVLATGENVLAVGIWNRTATSSDLVLVPRLELMQAPAIVRGPYLQNVTPDAVTVRWRTNIPTSTRLDWGGDDTSLDRRELDAAPKTDHRVRLTGLDPDTPYAYAVGTSDDLLAGDGEPFALRSAPAIGATRPLRIWVQGDAGTANADADAVYDAYRTFTADRPTDLWLMLGDNAYADGKDEEYQAAMFEPFAELLATTPLYSTLGNHDGFTSSSATQSGNYYDIFELPAEGEGGGVASGTEAYYSFDFGNVHVVVLNSYDVDRSPDGAMATWLQADLAATLQEWVIAIWHHPPYSKGSRDSDTVARMIDMRETFVAILESYGVDLTLTGHSHSYERSYLIDGHLGDSSTFGPEHVIDGGDGRVDGDGFYAKVERGLMPHSGAVHLVAGSSGQISGGPLNHPAMFRSLNQLGSVVLDVLDNRLDVAFLNSGGSIADRFTIVKAPPSALVADFSAGPLQGEAPLLVRFVDRSAGEPIAWAWDFEDDGILDASTQNPSHIYSTPGSYDVRQRIGNVLETRETAVSDLVCVTAPFAVPVSGLLFETPQALRWIDAGEVAYQVFRGALDRIELTNPGLSCVGAKLSDPVVTVPDIPPPGAALFYLVRPLDCADQAGTLDSGGVSQLDSRDTRWSGALGSTCVN